MVEAGKEQITIAECYIILSRTFFRKLSVSDLASSSNSRICEKKNGNFNFFITEFFVYIIIVVF